MLVHNLTYGLQAKTVMMMNMPERQLIMKLKVSTPHDPYLAAKMANFLVDHLDIYNRSFRNTKAKQQGEYIAGRLAVVAAELKGAEDDLAGFESHNRGYRESPSLQRKHQALEREVQASSTTWIELRRQLELARVDQNKQSAVVDVLDRAVAPMQRSRPNRVFIVFFSGFIAFFAFCSLVFIRSPGSHGE